jgi:AraC-like DNA-binding protein
MSPATLRRRLEEEGITYREIVDGLRRDLASEYLAKRRLAIGEIALLLGFSNQGAFSRSFRRWNGFSAAEYRQRVKPR